MSKIAVVYWSGTGNTEQMADYVAEGATKAGADVEIFTASSFNAELAEEYDAIAMGCPSMGAEELEDYEFLPMYEEIKPVLPGKPVVLFGSYDWGDGEWMNIWEEDVQDAGARLVCPGVICQLEPDENGRDQCLKAGEELTK